MGLLYLNGVPGNGRMYHSEAHSSEESLQASSGQTGTVYFASHQLIPQPR